MGFRLKCAVLNMIPSPRNNIRWCTLFSCLRNGRIHLIFFGNLLLRYALFPKHLPHCSILNSEGLITYRPAMNYRSQRDEVSPAATTYYVHRSELLNNYRQVKNFRARNSVNDRKQMVDSSSIFSRSQKATPTRTNASCAVDIASRLHLITRWYSALEVVKLAAISVPKKNPRYQTTYRTTEQGCDVISTWWVTRVGVH